MTLRTPLKQNAREEDEHVLMAVLNLPNSENNNFVRNLNQNFAKKNNREKVEIKPKEVLKQLAMDEE